MSEFSVNFDLHFEDPQACEYVATGLTALANDNLEEASAHFNQKGAALDIDPAHPTWGVESIAAQDLRCSGSVVAHAHGDFAAAPFLKSMADLGATIVMGTVFDETNRRRRLAYEHGKKVSYPKLIARLKAEDPGYALTSAVRRGKLKDVHEALAAGANPSGIEDGFPHIVIAAYSNAAIVSALIDAGADVNAIAVDGDNALRRAIGSEQFGAVDKLIDAGADVNAGDEKEDWRPLHRAAALEPEDRLRVMRKLVEAGARFDDTTAKAMSPLLLTVYNSAQSATWRSGEERDACLAASLETIDLLLEAGCSPDATYEGYGNLLDAAGSVEEIIEKVRSLGITNAASTD